MCQAIIGPSCGDAAWAIKSAFYNDKYSVPMISYGRSADSIVVFEQ